MQSCVVVGTCLILAVLLVVNILAVVFLVRESTYWMKLFAVVAGVVIAMQIGICGFYLWQMVP